MPRALLLTAIAASLLAATPSVGRAQVSVVGDADCFGTNQTCAEGATVPGGYAAITHGASDPAFMDRWDFGGAPYTWTHAFAPGLYSSATLWFRTVGLADVSGPYPVFVDGLLVGAIPFGGGGHTLVQTFSFSVSGSALADGVATVSFTPTTYDGFAIDYARMEAVPGTTSVPEPATLGLLGSGLLALGGAARHRRRRAA